MQRQRIIILMLLLLTGLAACSPGHLGGNEIAFVRDGHLWTIDPDGSNPFEVVSGSTAVIGYGWSPNHQIFVFRTLDSNFAHTAAAKHLASNPIIGLTADVPSDLNTVGIDGGSPIPITFPGPDMLHSNAWWNPAGNRLLYREETASTSQNPGTVSWWVSQNDQPEGIARKLLPYSFSIPSISSNSMAIGNSEQGVFTTTLAGTQFQFVIQGTLPGHPLPATLERVLWQPAHQDPAILYANVTASTTTQSPSTTAITIQLVLRDIHGHTNTIATCDCTQFAWSPDGNSILYSTGTSYTVFNIKDYSSFSITGEDGSVPYWSPDSKFILLDGLHTLQLVNVANHRQQRLLNDTTVADTVGEVPPYHCKGGSGMEWSGDPPPFVSPDCGSSSRAAALARWIGASGRSRGSLAIPGAHTLLQPVSNSIWASDSRHFLFLTHGRLLWQGKSLSSGNGLYTVSIDDHGLVQGAPTVVDTGNDTQAGWTYEDPNTSFLF